MSAPASRSPGGDHPVVRRPWADDPDQQNAATREIVVHSGAMRQIDERSEGRSTVHRTGSSRREHEQFQNTGDADLGFVVSMGALSNQSLDE